MILAVVNFLLCAFGVWVCVCRAAKMNRATHLVTRLQYVIWSTLLLASGGSAPLFGIECSPMQAALSAGIVINLCAGIVYWRHGVPSVSYRQIQDN
ncbi:MAG: hypothetical protein JNM52_11010 [Betaproteobacteria bacterium]|nr:hypothetical protein [Betaproteobacteria bacterium]